MSQDPNIPRWNFYRRLLGELIVDRSSSVLVVCGGQSDKGVFEELGYTNVTISNLASSGDGFAPYSYVHADVENLSFEDNSFDYAVVHAGLHHCQSPHSALVNMYRVSRKGILVFEAKDSLLMQFAAKVGLTVDYEVHAVASGSTGMRDTAIPNYIYRWTEREVRKTINSYAPHLLHQIRFFYGLCLPDPRLLKTQWRLPLMVIGPLARLLIRLMPGQGNLFSFFVTKPNVEPTNMHPWLTLNDGQVMMAERARRGVA